MTRRDGWLSWMVLPVTRFLWRIVLKSLKQRFNDYLGSAGVKSTARIRTATTGSPNGEKQPDIMVDWNSLCCREFNWLKEETQWLWDELRRDGKDPAAVALEHGQRMQQHLQEFARACER